MHKALSQLFLLSNTEQLRISWFEDSKLTLPSTGEWRWNQL